MVVAAALALRHPDLVDRLALVSPLSPHAAQTAAGRTLSAGDGWSALGIDDADPALDRHLGLDRRLDRMLDAAFQQGDAGLVGDRAQDVIGAHAHGLRALGAVWGYGGREELMRAGADVLLDSPADVPECV